MPAEIHPAAHVSRSAVLGEGTRVGPGAVIEDGVVMGKDNVIWPNAFVGRGTTLGDGNHVHPGAVIGHEPQDLAFDRSTQTFLKVGIGNKVILVNFAGVTGHCEVHDGAIMSGHTGIHQGCRIGKLTIMSALSTINKDLPPFMIFGGRPACAQGINAIGLRRAGIEREARAEIKRAYRAIYREGRTLKDAIEVISRECPGEECRYLVEFLRTSKRGIAAGAAEQFQTLKPHYNRGAQRRGEAEGASDDDEVPADEIL